MMILFLNVVQIRTVLNALAESMRG